MFQVAPSESAHQRNDIESFLRVGDQGREGGDDAGARHVSGAGGSGGCGGVMSRPTPGNASVREPPQGTRAGPAARMRSAPGMP